MYHKKHQTKARTRARTRPRTKARVRAKTKTKRKRFKKIQKGGGNKEANEFIVEINAALQQHCKKSAFKIIITKLENDDVFSYVIELLHDDNVISTIMLEINQDKIYMHSNTREEFKNKKYNTFLRSVVILYSYYMGFSIIGTNPSNWISYYIVSNYFDFYIDPTEFGSGDYNEWEPFTKGKPKLEIKESKKLLQKLTEKDDYPPFVLALNEIDLDKYKTLCIDILTKLDC
jgi:REP element-mobilizing transposase RayT